MSVFATDAGDDRLLLRRYAESADQAAFRALVERYSGLIHGVAMRRSGDADLAADVSQNVFAALARKSRSLVRGQGLPSVGAWLHRAATLETKSRLRARALARQRHRMIHEHFQPEGAADREGAHESIRPCLDEALARLPAADRDVVILRFYDGLDFSEVATRLGMRVAAVQKRSQRALEKLSRLLRRQGVAVSAVALGALLAPELARAAPAVLIAKPLSLSTAASGGTSTTATLSAMTLFGKSVSGGAIAAVVLLAVFLGAGSFVSVRRSGPARKDAPPPPPEVAARSSPGPDFAGRTGPEREAEARPRPPAVAQETGGIAATLNRLRELGAMRQKTMEEARALMQAGGSFDSLRSYLLKIEDIDREALTAFAGLGGDYSGALDSLPDDLEGKPRDWLVGMLFRSWAGVDPERALAAAKEHGTAAERAAWSGWGSKDPQAALAMQREVAAGDAAAGKDALLRIFGGWISLDPAQATKALGDLPPGDRTAAVEAFDDALQSESLRPALLDAAAAVEDESLRAALARNFCANWGKVAPDEAMAWLDTLRFDDPRLALPAAMDIVKGFARSGRTRDGADWIWPKLPEDLRTGFVTDLVAGDWAGRDRAGAEAWLKARGLEKSLPAVK
ncbi:MAG: sigE 1 [Akkermansiaceae bacterium]|nr:sigE 1 [Akkermansiaceae bacterium]